MNRVLCGAIAAMLAAGCAAPSFAGQKKEAEPPAAVPSDTAAVAVSSGAADARTNLEKLSDTNPYVRRNALIYLGNEKKKENVPQVLAMLADESADVRRAAVNALAAFGDRRAVQPLIEGYKKEANLGVKMNIITALGDLKSSLSVPLLRSLLKDPYPVFRTEAVRALGKINNPETYREIAAMLSDEAEGVKIMAANVSANLRLGASAPLLVKNLANPVAEVRGACALALGQVGDSSAVKELEQLLNDTDSTVAAAAKEAIALINAKIAARQTPPEKAPADKR